VVAVKLVLAQACCNLLWKSRQDLHEHFKLLLWWTKASSSVLSKPSSDWQVEQQQSSPCGRAEACVDRKCLISATYLTSALVQSSTLLPAEDTSLLSSLPLTFFGPPFCTNSLLSLVSGCTKLLLLLDGSDEKLLLMTPMLHGGLRMTLSSTCE